MWWGTLPQRHNTQEGHSAPETNEMAPDTQRPQMPLTSGKQVRRIKEEKEKQLETQGSEACGL